VLWLAVTAATAAGDFTVEPLGETDPFDGSESADDAAVWVHPTDPSLSLIVGNNKDTDDPLWGVHVYGLDGTRLDSVTGAKQNNVDVRYGFPLGDERVDLVASTNRTDDTIDFFTVNPDARTLVPAGSIATGFDDPYGLALWHDRSSEAYHVFVSDNDGDGSMRHWELFDDGGSVGGVLRRSWEVGSLTEGLVADDGRGHLFVGEENVGIWRYDAHADAPTGPADRVAVGQGGGEVDAGDVEGLALLYVGKARGEQGYLLASEQGNHSYAILERVDHDGDGVPYEYLDRFEIVSGNGIDGTSDTDGIEAIATGLNATFAEGLFIAQDGHDDEGGQNYKLVSWADVAAGAAAGLATDPGFDPRWDGRANLVWTAVEGHTWNVDAAVNWADAGSPRTFWQGDDVRFDDTGGGGTVTVEETVEPASVLVDNAAADYTLAGPGAIAGPCTLTKGGPGRLTLARANAYTGDTLVAAGTLIVAAEGALGTGAVLLGDAATPADAALLTDGPLMVGNAVTVQDDGDPAFTPALGGAHTAGTAVFSGDVTLGGDLALTAEPGGEVRLGGALNNADGQRLGKVGGGTVVLGGMQDHGPGSLLVVREGVLVLESDASGTGLIDDANLTVLVTDAEVHFGADQHLDTLDIGEGGFVRFTGAEVVVVRHLFVNGADLGPATLTPEPAALLLLAAGGLVLLARRRAG
jgi:3-phytase